MKRCPKCNNTYTDDSLKFCLTDGTPLDSILDGDKTIAFPDARTIEMPAPEPTARGRFAVPTHAADDSVPTVFSPVKQAAEPKSGSNRLIAGLLILLIIVILAGFTAIGAYFWMKPEPEPNISAKATPTVSPTPNEAEELKRKLAELEKQIAEQKSTKTETTTQPKTVIDNAGRTARANSPADGFLALRSEPNTETGVRLAKIPHGTSFTVVGCPRPTNPGKMRGKWCRVIYDGIDGWAFDAYMKFE
ncbi:MAG: SH3 domain-containing protein [Pyrinomonadaceae bacterium]|nr:SH3 domain-containing protein [Pyrinomonadaceae bacterium]